MVQWLYIGLCRCPSWCLHPAITDAQDGLDPLQIALVVHMKVFRHAGVESRIIFGQSSTPTNDSSLPIVTSMQRFSLHGLRQAYSKEKEKVATYTPVLWAMTNQMT